MRKITTLMLMALGFVFSLAISAKTENISVASAEAGYYSAAFGESWVRLLWNNNNSDAAGLAEPGKAEQRNASAKSTPLDMSGRDQLWSLVGDDKGFYLQNAVAGEELALSVSSTAEGTEAKFVAKGSACKWVLMKKGSVYAVVPANNRNMSLNSYGGPRKVLKLYQANDGGSKWKLQPRVVEAFKMTTVVEGENPYGDVKAVAGNLKFVIDGTATTSTVYTDAMGEHTYYLPAESKVKITQLGGSRGFTPGGLFVDGQETDQVELTVGESVGAIKAVFKASVENGMVLYFTPDAKGFPYRIPAIATAKNGDVFAISDNRPAGADIGYGEVDIKCRISKDNGQTWGKEFFIADGHGKADATGKGPWDYGFGDAAVVADCERNELLVMMVCGKTVCWDGDYDPNNPKKIPNRVAQVRAKLNETTGEWEWTKPKEVTQSIYPLFVKNGKATVQSLFIGSGRICQSRVTKVGDYYRLYCATWTKNEGNRVIYSDDFGDTWKVLGGVDARPGTGGDEPKCEELPNGDVILSSRNHGRVFNIYKFTDSAKGEGYWGVEQWSEGKTGGISVGNNTNGEILLLNAVRQRDNTKTTIALQSIPFGGGRNNVGFYFKEIKEELYKNVNSKSVLNQKILDLAENWTKGLQVSHVGSAYSTMTLQHDHKIGFFFEEEPGNYCMVYIPLTVEQITRGKYKLDEASYPTGVGQLIVDRGVHDNAIYDLSGRRVQEPEKGVYVVNGKKMIYK